MYGSPIVRCGLALDFDEVLTVHVAQRLLMHGVDFARLHARHGVRRADRVEDLTGHPAGRLRQAPCSTRRTALCPFASTPLSLHQEVERVRDVSVFERRLDLEDLHAGVGDHLPMRQLLVSTRCCSVHHEASAERVHVVVMTQ